MYIINGWVPGIPLKLINQNLGKANQIYFYKSAYIGRQIRIT